MTKVGFAFHKGKNLRFYVSLCFINNLGLLNYDSYVVMGFN